jgi:hypothetical protein
MVLKACHITFDATFIPRRPLGTDPSCYQTKGFTVFAAHLIAAMLLYKLGLGESLDVIVTLTDDGTAWTLTDLLGRSMGRIVETSDQQLTIQPDGHALETMAGMELGPYLSLDAALAAIERYTRGVCRLYPGEDQP